MSTSDREVAESDLIAFDWAKSLSQGEQDVILVGHLKQLQSRINAALTTARAEQAERVWKEAIAVVGSVVKGWASDVDESWNERPDLSFEAADKIEGANQIIAALGAAAIRAGAKEGKAVAVKVFPDRSNPVDLPPLPYVCESCGVQQDAEGICANCGSGRLRAFRATKEGK